MPILLGYIVGPLYVHGHSFNLNLNSPKKKILNQMQYKNLNDKLVKTKGPKKKKNNENNVNLSI